MTSQSRPLDSVDLRLLRLLMSDARLTVKELAAAVNLSATPVHERVKRLEREGYIKGYVAVVDMEKLDMGFTVFCSIKLRQVSLRSAGEFTRAVASMPQVTECYNISGRYDYLLKIHARNMKAYQEFILNVLGSLETIASLESTFVMDEIKQETNL